MWQSQGLDPCSAVAEAALNTWNELSVMSPRLWSTPRDWVIRTDAQNESLGHGQALLFVMTLFVHFVCQD